ncbi:MAG TPA: aminoacyl-tRNA hydrolase [Gemmatimonadaceae bacterium]|nr:aminoacyl-tRNA hydrolase [Gemmatimonadaceae bacterium]
MKLVVGLGNPGREYADTRHNVGWWVVDHLADVWRFEGWRKDQNALVSTGTVRGTRVRLLKPQTFMNLSGGALRPYLRREGFRAPTDLLIVVDEAALPVGRFRLRAQGSAGGHNGLKSVEGAVGGQEYARLRIGVGPPEDRRREGDLADYVLDRMGKAERAAVADLFSDVVATVETWIESGVEKAMSLYNRRPARGGEPAE